MDCFSAAETNEFSGRESSTVVERGEFNDEVDDDELGNAISQSSPTLSCQNNGAFLILLLLLLLLFLPDFFFLHASKAFDVQF
jgi:hypothetical protein